MRAVKGHQPCIHLLVQCPWSTAGTACLAVLTGHTQLRDHSESASILVGTETNIDLFVDCDIRFWAMSLAQGVRSAVVTVHSPCLGKYACLVSQRLRSGVAYQRTSSQACQRIRHRPSKGMTCCASSARANEPQLVGQRSQPWNYKLGAVYQHLLPGPLLFLPSLLQPVSTIISLEGAAHGHEWVHWLLSLLPVPQVNRHRVLSHLFCMCWL